MRYRYKGRGKIEANGYVWDGQGSVVEVEDDDTLRKLKTHPSFERV
jgi:hypothetical protein